MFVFSQVFEEPVGQMRELVTPNLETAVLNPAHDRSSSNARLISSFCSIFVELLFVVFSLVFAKRNFAFVSTLEASFVIQFISES